MCICVHMCIYIYTHTMLSFLYVDTAVHTHLQHPFGILVNGVLKDTALSVFIRPECAAFLDLVLDCV